MTQITADIITDLARNADDLAFELRIGRDIRSHALRAADRKIEVHVAHAQTYVDFRTGVERQFDYQCRLRLEWRWLNLAVECKNLAAESPVVVCGQERHVSESFHDLVFAGRGTLTTSDRSVVYRNTDVSELARVGGSDLYPAGQFAGKSVFRPRPARSKEEKAQGGFVVSKDREEYDAWNQAVGSAADMAKRSNRFFRTDGAGPTGFFSSVTLPVMVVPDGTLWRVLFDEAGAVVGAAEPVDEVTLFRDHAVPISDRNIPPISFTTRFSHIHFFTASGLGLFLHQMVTNDDNRWTLFFPALEVGQFTGRFDE